MISGLVIHLTSKRQAAYDAVAEIAANSAIETGELQDCRLPVVVEADDSGKMHDLTDWLASLTGVEHVDVAFADVEESLTAQPPETETQV